MRSVKLTDSYDKIEACSSNQKEEFEFASRASLVALDLPHRIHQIFHEFKRQEDDIAIHIQSQDKILGVVPPTPESFLEKENSSLIMSRSDMIHMIFSSLLGSPFGFRTQRFGHIVNTIIAQKDKEKVSNNSAGSEYDFQFHTEDAFHQAAPNHIGLLCMKNVERAATTLSYLDFSKIPSDILDQLFREDFFVTSNTIHQNVSEVINKTKKSVLFGSKTSPYFRINENTLNLSDYNPSQQRALNWVLDQLHKNRIDLTLNSGDFLYIDNYRVAHRRDSYSPNYGPELRWLKRIVTTNDLTKSSHLRTDPSSLVIENI